MRPRPSSPAIVALISLALAACASATSPEPSPSVPASIGPSESATPSGPSEPIGIAVIGHSGATGYDSSPVQSGVDVGTNSWATGTNPEVHSIYLRMLATDPAIEGHNANLAISGSDVESLLNQATTLAGRDPAPALVFIETMDNDIRCDGTDEENFDHYRSTLDEVIDTLESGIPDVETFIVSHWGTVAAYDRAVFEISPAHLTGDGPCDTVDPATGEIVPSKEKYLQDLVDAYWGIVTEVCEEAANCRTDGGAMQDFEPTPEDFTPDLNHLSISGLAKKAAIEWGVLGQQ
jgi:hypothetical protein